MPARAGCPLISLSKIEFVGRNGALIGATDDMKRRVQFIVTDVSYQAVSRRGGARGRVVAPSACSRSRSGEAVADGPNEGERQRGRLDLDPEVLAAVPGPPHEPIVGQRAAQQGAVAEPVKQVQPLAAARKASHLLGHYERASPRHHRLPRELPSLARTPAPQGLRRDKSSSLKEESVCYSFREKREDTCAFCASARRMRALAGLFRWTGTPSALNMRTNSSVASLHPFILPVTNASTSSRRSRAFRAWESSGGFMAAVHAFSTALNRSSAVRRSVFSCRQSVGMRQFRSCVEKN